MPYNAVKQTAAVEESSIVDHAHPPVIVTRTMNANVSTLKAGTIVMETDSGLKKYVKPTDDSDVTIVGITVEAYDKTRGNLVRVLRHGTVVKDRLNATEEEIADCESQNPIYAI